MESSQNAIVVQASVRAAAAAGPVLLTLASAQFLMALDSSVMNVSIALAGQNCAGPSPRGDGDET